ncbi:MAG: hypothetical protein RLY35_944 [Bacteroidota bacterium]|jgi:sodium-dependent dicarboxylate transporter 2/3/5
MQTKVFQLLLGPLLFVIIYFALPKTFTFDMHISAGLVAWMLAWWLTEIVPMAITSLLPILVFSATKTLSLDDCYKGYSDRFVFLFLGGFLLSLAFEKCGLHKMLANKILHRSGNSNRSVLFGFMLTTYLISMWISNTATAMMMMPLAAGVIHLFPQDKHFHRNLVLGIAYSASIGGMATLMGSPPNAAAAGILASSFGTEVSFFTWMKWGLPFSLALLIVGYYILSRPMVKTYRSHASIEHELHLTQEKTTSNQKRTLLIFIGVCTCWILQSWLSAFLGVWFNDTAIALIFASLLFVSFNKSALLDWEDTSKLPWGILLMFGGGLTMANGLKEAGWMHWLGHFFSEWEHGQWSLLVVIIAISILLTALMSNLAMVAVFIPIVAQIASEIGYPVLSIAIPVALASSCDFMFPMSTPPNAIAYSSGHVNASQMFKTGVWFNLISFLLLVLWMSWMH